MADKKISELTELTTPDGTEELVVNDSGVSKKVQIDNLITGIDDNATSTAITIDASENVLIKNAIILDNEDATVDSGDVLGSISFYDNDGGSASAGITSKIECVAESTYGASAIKFHTAGSSGGARGALTERMRVLSSGGITFNGDTAAANALDDYEEGTWTPAISFGGAVVGMVYSNQVGAYTKVGNMVTASCYCTFANKGSSTGSALLTGLPFTSGSTAGTFCTASMWVSSINFADSPQTYNVPNSSNMSLSEVTNAGAESAMDNTNFTNGSGIMINVTYRV